MKKKLFALALALLMLAALAIPALADSTDGKMVYIIDDADILTYDEWQSLEEKAEKLYAEYGIPAYIVIVDDYTDYGSGGIWSVADAIWDANELGIPGDYERADGFMLLMSMSERDFDNGSYGKGQVILTDYGKLIIEDDFLGYFRNDNWYAGFDAYLSGIEYCITQYNSGTPVDGDIGEYGYNENGEYVGKREKGFTLGEMLITALASLGIPGIVVGIGQAKMKNVRKKYEASDYIVPHSMRLTRQQDIFTHITQSRRRIERESSSGGGGSFHSGGGSSHHSGKF
ncbi:MAG: TPM domain-containing protein [Oscillospiraceae bacterium]|nr:TPM domain-containing protein [Oscillospiraceae bacterium]